MTSVTLDHVRAALALDDFDVPAAQRRMSPEQRAMRRSSQRAGDPRRASVLILLFRGNTPTASGVENNLTFALIQRTQNPHDRHSGQIGLPGGARESNETVIETALRETREELGVDSPIQILGQLTCLYIVHSDFEVRPVVGYVAHHPVWKPDAAEVVDVIECPVVWLLADDHKVIEDWEIGGQTRRVPWYNVNGRKVWGATAMILSEFEHRLKHVLAQSGKT